MKLDEVKKVGVLGGGIMGGGIAQVTALAGYDVVIRDINSEVIDHTRDGVFDGKWGIKRAVERGKVAFDDAVAAMNHMSFTTQLQLIRSAIAPPRLFR